MSSQYFKLNKTNHENNTFANTNLTFLNSKSYLHRFKRCPSLYSNNQIPQINLSIYSLFHNHRVYFLLYVIVFLSTLVNGLNRK
jgi:hypothetical protein